MSQRNSKNILKEFTLNPSCFHSLTTKFLLLAGGAKMALSFGLLEIVGVLTGVSMDFLESRCIEIIWELNKNAIGELLRNRLIGSI